MASVMGGGEVTLVFGGPEAAVGVEGDGGIAIGAVALEVEVWRVGRGRGREE